MANGGQAFLDFAEELRPRCQAIMANSLLSASGFSAGYTTCESDVVMDECENAGHISPQSQCYIAVHLIADGMAEDLDRFLLNLDLDGCVPWTQAFPRFCPGGTTCDPEYSLSFFSTAVPSDLNLTLTRSVCQYVQGFEEPGSDPSICPTADLQMTRYAQCVLIVDFLSCCRASQHDECYTVVFGQDADPPDELCNWLIPTR